MVKFFVSQSTKVYGGVVA